jgi:hypothetical protein
MSSVINNSNTNSALVNTLIASDSLMNPSVYSIKPIVPPHAVTYAKCQPSNGSLTAGGTLNFQLNKYGIMSQILLNIQTDISTPRAVLSNHIFSMIEQIDLLSSSRVVSTLTFDQLMAQFSNLPENKLRPIARTALLGDAGTVGVMNYTLPLVFGLLGNVDTQPNNAFLEPMSLRIKWSANLGTDVTLSDVYLNIRYRSYNEESNATILSQNYAKPMLNQLSSRFYTENRLTEAKTAGLATMIVELKNTDCVQNFYVMIKKVGEYFPVAIKSLVFKGSGQEICNLTEGMLQHGKIDTDGFAVGQDAVVATNNLYNIACFQTGTYGDGVLSNLYSLREINAPQITVSFTAETASYEMYVIEDCAVIYSTSSDTGRLDSTLSN